MHDTFQWAIPTHPRVGIQMTVPTHPSPPSTRLATLENEGRSGASWDTRTIHAHDRLKNGLQALPWGSPRKPPFVSMGYGHGDRVKTERLKGQCALADVYGIHIQSIG